MNVGKVGLTAARRFVQQSLVLPGAQLARDDGGGDSGRAADARSHDLRERRERRCIVFEGAGDPLPPHLGIRIRAGVSEVLQFLPNQLGETRLPRSLHGLIERA